MRSGNPYLMALATPGALRFSAAAFVGRMQISMVGLGTVLLISSLSGRYGLAGAVAAAGAAGYALVSPLVARLSDRFGQRAVLRPLMLVFAAATAALIFGAQARAPAWAGHRTPDPPGRSAARDCRRRSPRGRRPERGESRTGPRSSSITAPGR